MSEVAIVGRAYFATLAEALCAPRPDVDRTMLLLKAELSDFLRFNRSTVRQATHVEQAVATLGVVRGARRIECRITLTGRVDADVALLETERTMLVTALDELSDDPYLLLPDTPARSDRHETGTLPNARQLVDCIAQAAEGLDFVGFYAGGPVVRAFSDSLGTRHWHHVETFHIDWCLYHAADKAVKRSYAGTHWDAAEFTRRVAECARHLPLLAQAPRVLQPGSYRAWFAPAAMAEILSTLAWSGFGARERRSGTSSLMRLAHHDAALHPGLSLAEHTAVGPAPAFTGEGFARPARVSLVEGGLATDTLNSPRSAREYGLSANGANAEEVPEALAVSPGTLPEAEVLNALGTGLFVSNLWYLNYSDRPACRLTGLTRFACLWVEDGKPVAPVGVMRFDDSFLRMFGPGLLALGDRAELIAESSTYLERQLSSISTPGALVADWRLTL
jgi:predicted Zn-dependent protease